MYDYREFIFRTIDGNSGFVVGLDRSIFNPGLIMYNNQRLFSYRTGTDCLAGANVLVGQLDAQYTPISRFVDIQLSTYNEQTKYSLEDPRFFIYKNELYIQIVLYLVQPHRGMKWGRVAIAKYNTMLFSVLQYADDPNSLMEKNWIFFEYNNQLYCTYAMNRQHIVCKIFGNEAQAAYTTQYQLPEAYHADLRPTCNLVMKDGLLWGIAHYDIRKDDIRYYYCMFYAIEPTPPFKIVKIQREPFLHNPVPYNVVGNYTVACIFPSGLILEDKKTWVIAAGVNDTSTAFLRIPHSIVLDTLQDC